ncbi:unnamed protein product [Effrenium voratum]|uniref:Uncharacterized protein n=1 Tax=Effrenium voratum TaxID=2562239 RepID=A0AA36N714_9DINO|nr:unnamed protein product [Effrenium voratum]
MATTSSRRLCWRSPDCGQERPGPWESPERRLRKRTFEPKACKFGRLPLPGQQCPGDRLDLEEAGFQRKRQSQPCLAQVVAEADRVLQDNGTVQETEAVLRRWSSTWAKVAGKGLDEDSRGAAQVTSQHLWRGGVALRASPQQDSDPEEWLAKSREEVEGFSKAQVSSWVAAVLLDAGLEADDITEVTTILLKQKVVGAALLKLTLEKLIPHGPAMLLTRKIRLLQEPQVTEQVVTAKDFNIAACLRPSNGDRPKRFLELDSCVDDCMQAVQDNLPLVTKATIPRVPAAMLSRFMGGGKTTMLYEVFDRLKKEEKLPIFISFSGDSLVYRLDGEKVMDTMLRAIAVSLMKNKPADKKGAERVRCSEEALKAYLEDKKDVVLVVDELNVLLKSNPTYDRQALGRFLRDTFLNPAGRHLVLSTSIPTSAGLEQVLDTGAEGSRKVIPIQMPRCAEVQRLRGMHPNCAALTPLEAVYFGYVPSLIYSVKTGDLDLKDRFRDIARFAKSEGLQDLARSFLSEFFTGRRGSNHDPVRAFDALTESPALGEIRWILAYVGRMCCHLEWEQVGEWIDEIPRWSGKVESGQDWETVVLVALCLRCHEAMYSSPHELLKLPRGARRPADVHLMRVPQENCSGPSDMLAWWKEQPIPTYPYIAVLSPNGTKTSIIDVMWVYQKEAAANCFVTAIQAKLGKAIPKQDMPQGMLGLLFRGQAPAATRVDPWQRWEYLTARDFASFLGKSLTAACPGNWPSLTD